METIHEKVNKLKEFVKGRTKTIAYGTGTVIGENLTWKIPGRNFNKH